jgi:glycosyltransferase involved in cell wall biosynthesis
MVRPLRITLVTETYFPQVNGVSRTLDRLVRHCGDAGDVLQLLLPRYPHGVAELPPGAATRDWRAVPLPFYREVVLPLVTPGAIARELAAFRPELVHIATEGPLGWAALRAARKLKLPTVSSYHTNFAEYLTKYHAGWLAPICWQYLRRFHNATRMTFCPTPSTRRELEARGFCNVAVWSRGVDSERFHPGKRDPALRTALGIAPDDIVLAYAGRLAAEKNLAMLAEAWRTFPERGRCRLLFIGDGPLRRRLEEQAGDRCIFAGYRHGEELARMYASADLFVFPSVTETFGNVVLEAMASGLPAIGFAVQGPGDIITDGQTGRLVGTVAADALRQVMSEVVREEDRRRTMGVLARRHAEGQSWEQIMGGLRNAYAAAIAPELRHPLNYREDNRAIMPR